MNEESIISDELEKLEVRIPETWGRHISCDSGWWNILIELDKKLSLIDQDYSIHQIKEKFGGLRFYAESKYPIDSQKYFEFVDAISKAESESFMTCEVCGSKDKVKLRASNRVHWIKTLCEECIKTPDYLEFD